MVDMFGMTREPYHGFVISHEPNHDITKSFKEHWVNIDAPDGSQVFRIRMRVNWNYPGALGRCPRCTLETPAPVLLNSSVFVGRTDSSTWAGTNPTRLTRSTGTKRGIPTSPKRIDR